MKKKKKLTEGEARGLNNLSPGDQNARAGGRMKDLEENTLVELNYEVAVDLTGGLDAIKCPFDLEVLDVIVQARATSASGDVHVRKGSDDITDGIVMAADKAVTRAGTIDDAYSSFTEGQYINLMTCNAGDRGLVTILARRI